MGSLKKAYHWIAALALVHLLALGGWVTHLVTTGQLDVERVRAMAAVLRPDDGEAPQDQPVSAEDAVDEDSDALSMSPEQKQAEDEIAWRNADRYRAQIEQRLKFIRTVRVDVDRRREEFERAQKTAEQQQREREEKAAQPGPAKELEILSALSAKAALKQLMTMDDADAARIMFQFDARKAKKIVESAKTQAQHAKITTVLRLVRDMKTVARPTEGDGDTTDTP